jgi:hypothetical protein
LKNGLNCRRQSEATEASGTLDNGGIFCQEEIRKASQYS